MSLLHQTVVGDFLRRKSKNPQYSMRAYARYLGLNPTSLSLFMNGKRRLSDDAKKSIAMRLRMSSEDTTQVMQESTLSFEPLSAEKIRCLSDWFYFAILSLMETEGYREDPVWISERLNISEKEASEALDQLEKYGLAKKTEQGTRVPSGKRFSTSDQVRSLAVRRSHYQALDLARESLDNDDIDKRDFSAVTIAIDPERLPEAADRIKKFRRRLASFLEGGRKKEVYRLAIQLFPLSRGDKS